MKFHMISVGVDIFFGKNEFKDYFYELDEFKRVNENFNFKYMKISDIIIGVNHLNINL